MKFVLIIGLLLLSSCSGEVIEDDPTDTSSSIASSVATTVTTAGPEPASSSSASPAVPEASTVSSGTDGTTVSSASGATSQAPGSTVSGATKATEATTQAATTTTKPLDLTTLPIKNSLEPENAELILQHAYQLNQQILDLNNQLIQAKKNVDPKNSPLFDQLTDFSKNITAQNDTLQGYIQQLQHLQTSQTKLDADLNAKVGIFTCFSQSSCVTDPPTTPEPTTPGPTPSVSPCTNSTKTATFNATAFSYDRTQNVELCVISVTASTPTNNVSVTIDTTFGGHSNGYVQLVAPRTKESVNITSTSTGSNLVAFQQIDVYYYADPRTTIQFNFTYQEVNNCLLDCHTPNGECRVSPSGIQYCECKKCEFEGDRCEKPIGNPCLSKQKRACKESQGFGQCYLNPCYDQCYACNCAANAFDPNSNQVCTLPTDGSTPAPIPPTVSPSDIVCPSTAAPSTTTALFTTTVTVPGSSASTGSSEGSTVSVPAGSSASTGSSGSISTISAAASTTTKASGSSSTVSGGTNDGDEF